MNKEMFATAIPIAILYTKTLLINFKGNNISMAAEHSEIILLVFL